MSAALLQAMLTTGNTISPFQVRVELASALVILGKNAEAAEVAREATLHGHDEPPIGLALAYQNLGHALRTSSGTSTKHTLPISR